MTLEQAMEYINNIPHIGKRDGVNRVRPLLHLLGDPQQQLAVRPCGRHQRQGQHRWP